MFKGAELVLLQAARSVTLVLAGSIVAALALSAGQLDDFRGHVKLSNANQHIADTEASATH